jgi:2-polyprenyl-3-methyl-5-hydroxy-6-metoxy-1,4-benzoquinol methylase
VLFKGVPDVLNEHFHNWHKRIILDFVEGSGKLRILDVGCGYGRLSIPIIKKFPEVDITGVDISENYVRLYTENTCHPAIVVGIENMSSDLGSFDYILCVTVLMYLDEENLGKAVFNLVSRLKPKGKLILIEPHQSGILFQTGFGLLSFVKKRMRRDTLSTQGRSFRMNEIETLFTNAGGRVLREYRLPITSLFFLPFALLGRLLPIRFIGYLYKTMSVLDTLLGGLRLPSIHVAYLIAKNKN